MTVIKNSDNLIRMKSVKSFNINVYWFNKLSVRFLPFSFERLENFYIYFPKPAFHSYFTEEFLNFIGRHSTIRCLLIEGIKSPGIVDWSRLAKCLPLLNIINIFDCPCSTSEAIEIIDKCQMLEKFCFKLKGDEYYDSFLKEFPDTIFYKIK